jgi:uncharacterized repeat protein (TIGR01451 family)
LITSYDFSDYLDNKKKMKAVLLVLVLATVAVLADVKAKPYLVAHKEVSEGATVVGAEVKFTVTITNNGDSPAFDVQLVDKSPSGEDQTKAVEKLEPQQAITLEYTWKATKLGEVQVPAAKATFLEDQSSTTRSTSISNLINEHERESFEFGSKGELQVVTGSEYERLHTRYVKETIGYFLVAAVPVLFPLYMYRTKQAQVDHLLRDAKRSK